MTLFYIIICANINTYYIYYTCFYKYKLSSAQNKATVFKLCIHKIVCDDQEELYV